MVSATKPIRADALGNQVAQRLRELIITRELLPGSHLVEDSLASRFDVSRGPIRDALRILEAEGLVASRRRGIFIVGITLADIEDLYALREAIEMLALELAMVRAAQEDWGDGQRLVTVMDEAASANDPDGFTKADIEFHTLFYTLSRHRRLADVWGQYEPIFSTLVDVTVHQDADLHPSAVDHQKLLNLVREGDVVAASDELRAHLHGAKARMLDAYRNSFAPSPLPARTHA